MNNSKSSLFDRYKALRSAPDAVMIGNDFKIGLSLFHRNKREIPIWSMKSEANGIEYSAIDSAVIIGSVTCIVFLLSSLAYAYCKLRFARRW